MRTKAQVVASAASLALSLPSCMLWVLLRPNISQMVVRSYGLETRRMCAAQNGIVHRQPLGGSLRRLMS